MKLLETAAMSPHKQELKTSILSANGPSDKDIGRDIEDLRAALEAIDNARHHSEVSLFNQPRLESPSISPSEQVAAYKKAKAAMSARSLEQTVAGGDDGDYTHLPRSMGTGDCAGRPGKPSQVSKKLREQRRNIEFGHEEGFCESDSV